MHDASATHLRPPRALPTIHRDDPASTHEQATTATTDQGRQTTDISPPLPVPLTHGIHWLLPGDIIVSALIVIPARYGSTRFPGKPLLRDSGKFLIQHVVEQAAKAKRAAKVVVATDDARIKDAVESFDAAAVMTSPNHQSGTDRIAEVMLKPEFAAFDVVVNVQGDEPEIEPELIDNLIRVTSQPGGGIPMATVAAPFANARDIANPNIVKVVVDQRGNALYFSRSVIPFDRDGLVLQSEMGNLKSKIPQSFALAGLYRKHLGIYAYQRTALLQIAQTPPCDLEKLEKLEQLRALFLGLRIHVLHTTNAPSGIDTPEDYAAFLQRLASR